MMKEWTIDAVRRVFLDYFTKKNHTLVDSSPLLPAEDKTLLFTNAGMNQFKNIFLGQETRSYSRAVTAQKCVRAGGKHNDLENVGFTARHHTFFEMLGNFSFGDYFKKEAILFAWDMVTNVFKLDVNRLYVTIYKDDDEAFRLWRDEAHVPESRIFRLGEKDNFWSMGDTGPCGPCSEIHYDLDPSFPTDEPFINGEPNWDCGRFMEIWNLVFMQYNRDEKGNLTPLPKPSIDTGMGLERITAALNGYTSNYQTDIFASLISYLDSICPEKHHKDHPSFKVIADHARATAFLIADSITPSNEGRGYVLRRIMRRAIRHGHKLGFNELFFYKVCGKVIEIMGEYYKELKDSQVLIESIAAEEEKRFRQTLDKGLAMLETGIGEARECGKTILPGSLVFKLYDTYGFPPDLTQTILSEKGFSFDSEEYDTAMKMQQQRGKASWEGTSEEKRLQAATELKEEGIELIFDGYGKAELEGEVLAILNENFERIDSAKSDLPVYLVISPLLFYAESGGQIGDKGTLEKDGHVVADVRDCTKFGEYRAVLVKTVDEIMVGEKVKQRLEKKRRLAIQKNHSATHLLHIALKHLLGSHVNQAGSLVTPERLRFDFSHFKSIPKEDLIELEKTVNAMIQQDRDVCTEIKRMEEAKKDGATALFGEKYGETVRVVTIGDSKELCGGTHVARTGEIGCFKIIKEEGIAAGVRRIEAVTGMEAITLFQEYDIMLGEASAAAGTERSQLSGVIEKMKDTAKLLTKQVADLHQEISGFAAASITTVAEKDGISIFCIDTKKGKAETIALSDSLKSKVKDGLFVLFSNEEQKALCIVSATGLGKEKYDAGALLKKLLEPFGGRGGGRKDMAQGGADSIDGHILKEKLLEIM